MGIPQETIDGLNSAYVANQEIINTVFDHGKKPNEVNMENLKKVGHEKLCQEIFGFVGKLRIIHKGIEPMRTAAKLINKEFDTLADKYEKVSLYSNIMDKIDEHLTDWRGIMLGEGSGAGTPRVGTDESAVTSQLYFIGIRPTGTCSTCEEVPGTDDTLGCNVCKNYFHATNCLDEHKSKKLATVSLLKSLRTASKNFKWMCNVCSTRFEQACCSNVQSTAVTLTETVNKLTSQMDNLKLDMDTRFDKITDKIVESNSGNVWSDKNRLSKIRSSLLIKPDDAGKPVELDVIRELAVKNGIQVDTAKVTSDGKTFINLPSTKNRDKLTPLLQSSSLAKAEQIVNINSKLPTISIVGIEEIITKESAAEYVLSQNPDIQKLVDIGETFNVVFIKKPTDQSGTYTVIARVSPKIRELLHRMDNRIHIGLAKYRVHDRFYIKRCNKCQAYHHYENECGKDVICGYCRSHSHVSKKCSKKDKSHREQSCYNCQISGKDESVYNGHNTMWYNCPTYKEEQLKLKKTINYNYESLN